MSDYKNMISEINRLKILFPFLKVQNIGKTAVGREITAISIGEKIYKKDIISGGPIMVGTIDGNDWISGKIILNLIEKISKSLQKNISFSNVNFFDFLKENTLTFVPILNPDGLEISKKGGGAVPLFGEKINRLCGGNFKCWKANARCVDIKYNFPFLFEENKNRMKDKNIFGKNPYGYGGEKPESEPETVSIINFCKRNNFSICFSLFSSSKNGEIFWRNSQKDLCGNKERAKILSSVSGYNIEADFGPITYTGLRNWFSNEFSRPAIDIVIKDSPYDIFKSTEEILVTALLM